MLFDAIPLSRILRIIYYGVYQENHHTQELQSKMEIKEGIALLKVKPLFFYCN